MANRLLVGPLPPEVAPPAPPEEALVADLRGSLGPVEVVAQKLWALLHPSHTRIAPTFRPRFRDQ